MCTSLEIPVGKKEFDMLSMHSAFLKRYSEREIYLINPIDSDLICDINTLFYYKENNSKHILLRVLY